ncbi:putative nuclease HARBI1 [Prorops nasuta]|uniref:putative nuclease HARBI1 n=1 Tax=Prorops nasuta TaxID=863751 RepID=UPI0034CD4E3B
MDEDNIPELSDVSQISPISSDTEDDNSTMRCPKRYIRNFEDPFDRWNEIEFKKRFRFSKESVIHGILPLCEKKLSRSSNRGLPITPVLQLLIALRYYATSSFQLIMGDVAHVSQPTVSRIVNRVTTILASNIYKYIKMPVTSENKQNNRRLFKELGRGSGHIGLPNIDGAIDCTHIRLTSTKLQNINEAFRNRKNYFSLNVQAVVGPNTEILDVVPEWPGSEHDSRIFQNSRLFMRYQTRQLDGMLVGDSGYPSLPFVLTPINNPVSEEEIRYNQIQVRTRIVVERTFGILKRRFPCLSKGLTTKLQTCTSIVVTCAILHNLSLIFNDILPEDEENFEFEEDEPETEPPHWQPGEGFIVRSALIERLFG